MHSKTTHSLVGNWHNSLPGNVSFEEPKYDRNPKVCNVLYGTKGMKILKSCIVGGAILLENTDILLCKTVWSVAGQNFTCPIVQSCLATVQLLVGKWCRN